MKILFNNLIYSSTLSADTQNNNFPLTNLQSDFPDKIYKATQESAIITIELSAIGSINCFYITNTNATGAVIGLYNSSNSLLKTVTLDLDRNGQSFPITGSVKKIILTLAGSDIIYLGCIGFGYAYTTPLVQNDVIPKPIDNSIRNSNDYGNFYINPIPVRQSYDITFPKLTRAQYNELFNLWAGSIYHPLWSDVYDNSTGEMNPMFGVMINNTPPEHEWKRDSIKFTFTEAK